MEINLRSDKSIENKNTGYRSLIVVLLYVATATCPDISYSIVYLSLFIIITPLSYINTDIGS